jgi:para-nitrobenzyl esterase
MKANPVLGASASAASVGIDRRAFLRAGSAAVAGGALLTSATAALAQGTAAPAPNGYGAAGTESIARTRYGRVRGIHNGKAHVFKGIPYGAPATGDNRFMPPREPQPWSGIRAATRLGDQTPQLTAVMLAEEVVSLDNSPFSEDCLYLNVWTPAVGGAAHRPVMVWFHGGGFTNGSGGDVRYDGSNLANQHDVVVVTVNERLNAFGFLYLGQIGGERYADSGNAGLLDLVAALRWVHNNIHEFGGDPGNVTIFGQSGGGGKVSTLMATPAAKGLFHRAICESGLAMKAIPPDQATETTHKLMQALELQSNEIDRLRSTPVDDILAAMSFVASSARGGAGGLRFGPVIDKRTLFRDPWTPDAPAESADVPMLLGSVLTEGTFMLTTPRDPINDRELHQRVQHLGMGAGNLSADEAEQLIALYRRDYPGVANTRLFQIMTGDNWMIPNVTAVGERKAAQHAAPAYVYHWEWTTPVEGGRLGAPHTIEIPFVFDNLDVPTADIITGRGQDRFAMADRASRAWTAFARTGNPNISGLPNWEPYSADRRAVMIFNNECRLAIDPHAPEREAMTRLSQRST